MVLAAAGQEPNSPKPTLDQYGPLALGGSQPRGTGRYPHKTFHSKTIDADVSYLVYLPPDSEQKTVRYPVLYFLHGSGGTPRGSANVAKRLDKSTAPAGYRR